jgi:FixJ family two-component response regulator
LIAVGYTNKEIEIALDVSLESVETRRAAVMEKLRLLSSAKTPC